MQINSLGVTKPISVSLPTKEEEQLTSELIDVLKQYKVFEMQERTAQRQNILNHLTKIAQEFVHLVCIRRNVAEENVKIAGGAVVAYGSCRLGVQSDDSDIDALCVLPKYVYRTDFFMEMVELLNKVPAITNITTVPDSYVPVIKFYYDDIPIDLICTRLNVSSVSPDMDLNNINLLENLDEKCIRSINGIRVANDILSLVPNIETFQTALHCIKLWAKETGIYSAKMGFLGGVAWAILVARICQLYPNSSTCTIVSRFFYLFKTWNWSRPILLKPLEERPPINNPVLFRSWNPRKLMLNPSKRISVLTPSFPNMCSTYNVTDSTQRIIEGNLKRASDIVERVIERRLPWSALFEEHSFFKSYKLYLQVVVSARDNDQLLSWSGLVGAKLRHLILQLESTPAIGLAQPYVDTFKHQYSCQSQNDVYAATHGLELQNSTGGFMEIVNEVYYIGLYIRSSSVLSKQLDLRKPICDFLNLVKSSPDYNEYTMGITIDTKRQADLPKEVFSKVQPVTHKRPLVDSAESESNHETTTKKPKTHTPALIPESQ